MLRQLHRGRGGVGADVVDGRRAALADLHRHLREAHVLLLREVDRLAGPARDPEAVHPRRDVVLQHGAEALVVDGAVGVHGRNDCRLRDGSVERRERERADM